MVSFHKYLVQILDSNRISPRNLEGVRKAFQEVKDNLSELNQHNPRIYYGGSYAKNTMIDSEFDLDIVIYFPHTVQKSVEELYNYVHKLLSDKYKSVSKLGVAVRIDYSDFDIDVVTGKAEDTSFQYANLYNNILKRKQRSSLQVQLDNVKNIRAIIILMKLWRERKKLNWHKLAMEQSIASCLSDKENILNDYGESLKALFLDLKSNIDTVKFFDPTNSNNPIEVSNYERSIIKECANSSYSAIVSGKWDHIFK